MNDIIITIEPDVNFYNEPEEIFSGIDENVIITGNKNFTEYCEADFYFEIKDIISDLDCYFENDIISFYKDKYSIETIKKLVTCYDNNYMLPELELIKKLAGIIYPKMQLETGVLRGCCQSDWQNVLYKKDFNIDLDVLSDYYFGNICELSIESNDDIYWQQISNTELFKLENSTDIKKAFKEFLGLSENENIIINKFSGYTQIANYETIA